MTDLPAVTDDLEPEPEPLTEPRRLTWWFEEPGYEEFHQYLKDLAAEQIREFLKRPLPVLRFEALLRNEKTVVMKIHVTDVGEVVAQPDSDR